MQESNSFLESSLRVNKPRIQPFLKWGNEVIGVIGPDYSVDLVNNNASVIKYMFGEREQITPKEFWDFLEDRLPSRSRRDIDKILFKCGLTSYNVWRLASKTRAINARDLIWLSETENEKFEEVLPEVFERVFLKKMDFDGGSVNSPDGMNIKRYGVYEGKYGIFKKRLHPHSYDAEMECISWELANLLGVPCCPAKLVEPGLCFSEFVYNFAQEYIVHIRRGIAAEEIGDNLYSALVRKFPFMKENLQKMILFDFITRQEDRHLSNMSVLISGDTLSFYPLYDNGRSLFFQDRETLMKSAVKDIRLYATEFGPVGTYYDAIYREFNHSEIKHLIDLDINKQDIEYIFNKYDIPDDTKKYAIEWINNSMEFLRSLG